MTDKKTSAAIIDSQSYSASDEPVLSSVENTTSAADALCDAACDLLNQCEPPNDYWERSGHKYVCVGEESYEALKEAVKCYMKGVGNVGQ